ncbi:MAG: cytochrome c3 family protein [Gemmatimonadetes bacterium]|jgi:hypothetical protein|nr:cytochrome c3 family protein [Gemmatimonadota bacterium]
MKKQWLIGGTAGVLALAALAFARAQDAQQAANAESPDNYPSGQPIAFPHNIHAGSKPGEFHIDCMYCHFSAERSVDAGLPPMSLCVGCHQVIPGTKNPQEIKKLMGYWQRKQPIPWVRIYKTPDHVHFPHARHIHAGLTCQECHGQVQDVSVINHRDPVWGGDNMGWCVSCHRKKGVSTTCAVCHY